MTDANTVPVDTSRERIEKLHSIGCADYIHLALLAERDRYKTRAERAEAALVEIKNHAQTGADYIFDSCDMCENTLETIAQIDAKRKTVFDSVSREEWQSMDERGSNPSVGKPRTFAEGDNQ
jgi:hypothetical protein